MGKNSILILSLGAVCLMVGFVSAIQADQTRRETVAPKEVSLTGRVVDLQCFMTGRFPTADEAKCTRECIKAGVPAALETDDGLVILGQGTKGASRAFAKFGLKNVEVRGMIYERQGLRYMDITTAREIEEAHSAVGADTEEESDEMGESDENSDSDWPVDSDGSDE